MEVAADIKKEWIRQETDCTSTPVDGRDRAKTAKVIKLISSKR